MEEDKDIIVYFPKEDGIEIRVPKDIAVAGSGYLEGYNWKEKVDGVIERNFLSQTWITVTAALQGKKIAHTTIQPVIQLNILELVRSLQPKDTTIEGKRLFSLFNTILKQLPRHFAKGTVERELSIEWALNNDNLEALATIDPDELKDLEVHKLSPRIVNLLVQLPKFADKSAAPKGLWESWRKIPTQTNTGEAIKNAVSPQIRIITGKELSTSCCIVPWGDNLILPCDKVFKILDVSTPGTEWIETAEFSIPDFETNMVEANEDFIAVWRWKRAGGLFIWTAATRRLLHEITCPPVLALAMCEKSIATVHVNGIQVWNMESGKQELHIDVDCTRKRMGIYMTISLARSFVVMHDEEIKGNRKLTIWDCETGVVIQNLDEIDSYLLKENVLYTAAKGCIQPWVRSGDSMEPLERLDIGVDLYGLFCEGTTIVGIGNPGADMIGGRGNKGVEIKKWDLATGKPLPSILLGEAGYISTLTTGAGGLIVHYGEDRMNRTSVIEIYRDISHSALD